MKKFIVRKYQFLFFAVMLTSAVCHANPTNPEPVMNIPVEDLVQVEHFDSKVSVALSGQSLPTFILRVYQLRNSKDTYRLSCTTRSGDEKCIISNLQSAKSSIIRVGSLAPSQQPITEQTDEVKKLMAKLELGLVNQQACSFIVLTQDNTGDFYRTNNVEIECK